MKRFSKCFFNFLVLFFFSGLSYGNNTLPFSVHSPDQNLEMKFTLDELEIPVYSVLYNDQVIIAESNLGIEFDKGIFSEGLRITGTERDSCDETYNLVAGKSKHVRSHYNELFISLQEKDSPERKLNLIFRAFDNGAAFRYHIPEQGNFEDFLILSEKSEFCFSENHTCWALKLNSFTTNYERKFNRISINDIGPDSLIGLPLTIELNSGSYATLCEANLTDYAGMYLEGVKDRPGVLVSRLSPLPNKDGVCVKASAPHYSPWRVIMIGDEPGDLIESDIILNLNEPCAIPDPSWIKPGKVAWPWWSDRTVTGVDFEGGMNTATQKHYIDFASEFGLEYLLIDAKWYGSHKDTTEDITTTIPEIDMPEIISYAKQRNVDVILWINWINTRKQMDQAFPLYENWGIKGVKVDYMNRDDQEMVNFYHLVVKKAAEHHLLVDFHGAYKPAGIRRTYPNLITREGIMGLEHTKWSKRVTPEHNVTIPFTRMLAGPMDYTPGAFQNVTEAEFEPQFKAPTALGTRCHHLAMFVVYESPLQMVSDYPGSYRGEPGSDFIKVVPASWDETKVIAGKIGDYIAIARKRGKDWFIGVMTDWDSRSLVLPLKFLGEGEYNARIYADRTDEENNPKSVEITNTTVSAADSMTVKMASGGGSVVHLLQVVE